MTNFAQTNFDFETGSFAVHGLLAHPPPSELLLRCNVTLVFWALEGAAWGGGLGTVARSIFPIAEKSSSHSPSSLTR